MQLPFSCNLVFMTVEEKEDERHSCLLCVSHIKKRSVGNKPIPFSTGENYFKASVNNKIDKLDHYGKRCVQR